MAINHNNPIKNIGGFLFELTCGACPEQYDVYKYKKQVAYLRLRHGVFSVYYPDVGGELIFRANPDGDGCFTDEERAFFLKCAVLAIKRKIKKDKIGDY